MGNQYGEPWGWVPHERGGDYGHTVDSSGRPLTRRGSPDATLRAIACVNTLAGVPDAALTDPTEAQRFALAVLRGEADALILADYLQENHAAEMAAARAGKRFVSRKHLLETLQGLVGMFNRECHIGSLCWKASPITDGHKKTLLAVIEDAGG